MPPPPQLRGCSTLPLPPLPEATLECLLRCLHRIRALLLRRYRRNDAVVSRATDEVLWVGLKVLKNGKAESMSPRHRAGWLWTTAKRAAGRAAKREVVQVPLEFDPADLRSRRPDEESPEDPPLFLALREAVDHLPARQRQAVELRFWQGLSVRATARAMGIGVSTVAEHLQKARTNLARTLSALYQTCVPETGSDPNTGAF